ncbi:unnamed protein product [Callosobruchus maculatus]|uniref:Uncharacterized protein n=1 Tax=Callosobruchus maculatus TaxID=64391 RepID=A0A653CJH1_CALMS|nr:unnamed protein product [Callosobruchus maculatus]
MNQRHFCSFCDVIVTPYFSKLCHDHTCLLNAPYPNCRSKNRGVYKTLNYFTTAY